MNDESCYYDMKLDLLAVEIDFARLDCRYCSSIGTLSMHMPPGVRYP